MNVLIFVMTMLMLLTLMTYARIDSYRTSQGYQIIFKHFMQKDERGYINEEAKEGGYYSIKVKEKEEPTEGKKKSKKVDASPRISISLLLDPKRNEKEKEWGQTKILLGNLMRTLYSKQPFYLKLEAEHHGFVDDLIQAITQAIDELPKERKPKKPIDLGNLKLSDPKLDRVLYKMLNGALFLNVVTDEQKKAIANDTDKVIIESAGDDDDASNRAEEYKSPEGYYSLLDYLTERPSKQVRIYLASENVLLSIFSDQEKVNAIIRERESLHKQVMADSDPDQLSESFKNQFLKSKASAIEDDTLNFTVNKTNPKGYR